MLVTPWVKNASAGFVVPFDEWISTRHPFGPMGQ